jgi:hypothetical protein
LFSYFARLDSFSEVPSASGPIVMFCALGLILGGTEGVGSRFHVLRARAHFRRYGGHRVPYSFFVLPRTFSAVRRASSLDFIFWFPFSCFARPDSFSAVPRASGPIFIFCALVLVFSGIEGIRSRFHVLRF